VEYHSQAVPLEKLGQYRRHSPSCGSGVWRIEIDGSGVFLPLTKLQKSPSTFSLISVIIFSPDFGKSSNPFS
jgi:predicted secreted protein